MKRRIFKLCLFLLLGALINVAVAWACVCSSSHVRFTPTEGSLQDRQFWSNFPTAQCMGYRAVSVCERVTGFGYVRTADKGEIDDGGHSVISFLPIGLRYEVRAGWPVSSLCGRATFLYPWGLANPLTVHGRETGRSADHGPLMYFPTFQITLIGGICHTDPFWWDSPSTRCCTQARSVCYSFV